MADSYKLPICWLGKQVAELGGDGLEVQRTITDNEVNLDCHCFNAVQAHFCMEGHMTECHAGMSCEDAKCSHHQTEEEYFHGEKGGEDV